LDIFSRAQVLETLLFMSHYLLSSQGDRMAMAHSVEIRLPYLDHRLWEFMGRVPSRRKMPGLNEKALLKRCLRHDLPDVLLQRSKHPYRAPIRQSLLDPAVAERTEETLSEGLVKHAGLFDPAKVRHLLRKVRSATQPNEVDDMALAGIFTAQVLHREMVERSPGIPTDDDPWLFIDRRRGHPSGNRVSEAGGSCR